MHKKCSIRIQSNFANGSCDYNVLIILMVNLLNILIRLVLYFIFSHV